MFGVRVWHLAARAVWQSAQPVRSGGVIALRSFSSFREPARTEREKYVSVEHEHDGQAVHIVLNRPALKNALCRSMAKEISECVEDMRKLMDRRNPAAPRVVVIRSAVAGAFCSGADLKERKFMSHEQAREFSNFLRRTFANIASLPIPVIGCVAGYALGGGAELLLACDIRVGSSKAVLGFPETSHAIIPGAGGSATLARLVGISRAKDLIFTARRVSAREAKELGLLNYVCGDDSDKAESGELALQKTRDLTAQIIQNGPLALKLAKRCIDSSVDVDLPTALLLEGELYKETFGSKDREEGLEAFNEKRKPVYVGR
ncbi:Methylglutaconyl-CoA hydratase, mitochondrial [Porphyridium purpureum]|uniref:Methylglutaconyl-CoA hydratase, mitochondrial n=1 Tax=Porphyridium purpureum TaxID=35688 RepID=A0A5J4Z420_PORPP|nr:Methylglutaconyl-CoA hydratase, mitochondrial [Porphyridium purpureum]|eukprot:POR2748..scf295_1